jgi:hypothetical protein
MQLLIESENASHNWGNASMLHGAIRRLLEHIPGASVPRLNERSAAYDRVETVSPRHRRKAKRSLPGVQLVALRENRQAPALLRDLGVEAAQITATGDDAVRMADQAHPDQSGTGLGANLRLAPYANVDASPLADLDGVLTAVGAEQSAPVSPIPIACKDETADVSTLQRLLDGRTGASDGGGTLDSVDPALRSSRRTAARRQTAAAGRACDRLAEAL